MSLIKGFVAVMAPAVVTVALLLAVDFAAGQRLLDAVQEAGDAGEKLYRVADPVYHHTLAPNFTGIGTWGSIRYPICTNALGLKDTCDKALQGGKHYDIAFIGDSFTEGVGLPYEQTFVGQIAASLPNQRIANLGVSSYAPSVYLSKVLHLLEQGVTFKELVVYVDISDVQDEATAYMYSDGKVIDQPKPETSVKPSPRGLKEMVRETFPLSYFGLYAARKALSGGDKEPSAYVQRGHERSAWTYQPDVGGYGTMGVDAAVTKSVEMMTALHEALKERGIALSVGVYPWPGQLLYDVEDSRQVQIWQAFCEGKCRRFYNSFPTFFAETSEIGMQAVLDRYFIAGDAHHTAEGASLIAKDFLAVHDADNPPVKNRRSRR